jgi:hypothetical protein
MYSCVCAAASFLITNITTAAIVSHHMFTLACSKNSDASSCELTGLLLDKKPSFSQFMEDGLMIACRMGRHRLAEVCVYACVCVIYPMSLLH